MDNGIEGIGDAVTGGLAARAVEPGDGEGVSPHSETHCLNCSTELVGTHCHYCGQKAHVHRSIGAIGHDLIHGVLHLDGKFWRTVPLLVLRPGQLTRRYIHGERAKFVSPLGMFLFGVFLMFGILTIYGVSLSNLDVDEEATEAATELARGELEGQLATARQEQTTLSRNLAILDSQPGEEQEAGAVRARLAELEGEITRLETGQQRVEAFSDTMVSGEDGSRDFVFFGDRNFSTGWDRLDHGFEKINDNPGLALYKLQANFYKFSWLLIPLSVPFVWLLFFYTRRFKMYDHTVFVTYSLAFMSLFAILLTVLGFAGMGISWIPLAAVFIPFLHLYKQLRGTYQIGRISAFLRTVLLSFFCFTAACIFFVILLGIGALG